MKRALAERAKQSGLPNGVGPSAPATEKPLTSVPPPSSGTSGRQAPVSNSSSNAMKAPLKIERHEPAAPSSSNAARSPRNSSASPRPKKRMRESVVKLEEEDEEDANASAFYLRHQNHALASELRSMKFNLSRLERERDYRRSQCTQAVQCLNAVEATWSQMEAALQCVQPPSLVKAASPPATSSSSASAPVSTGSGMSVELIGALLDSLAALGSMSSDKSRRRMNGDDGEDSSSVEANGGVGDSTDIDASEKQHLDDMRRITDNIEKRAATLQNWIWSLLQRVESSSNASMEKLSDEAQQQVVALKAKNKSLKSKLKEVSRSRDEMFESEKRVRRGLYRLAAGRVQLKEVLKAIATSDEDKEAAAAWMEAPPPAPVLSPSVSATVAKPGAAVKSEPGATNDSKKDSKENAEIQKQIADLETVTSARDEQIQQVRIFWRDGLYRRYTFCSF